MSEDLRSRIVEGKGTESRPPKPYVMNGGGCPSALRSPTGAPLATLMNYGVHPVVLINNSLVSTDFVGMAERNLEREVGGTAIWFTGAQGDHDPVYVRFSYPEAE